MKRVTVVPADRLIIVNEESLIFDFVVEEGIHAIQWKNDCGHIEYIGKANKHLTASDYDIYVKPYIDAFINEKSRLKIEAERQQKEYDEWYNSKEQVAIRVREEREKLISATDYLVMPDYPISEEKKKLIMSYRQQLRDITKQPSFPNNIIWPEKPTI